MAMSFSTWSIRNPVPPLLLFAILMLAGTVAFLQLPVTALPAIVNADVNILAIHPGATPAEMEMQTTQRIEDAVATLQGVKRVSSDITEGRSSTTVEFDLDIGIDRAMNDVRNAIASIRQDLPVALREPIVTRATDTGRPVGIYIVDGPQMPMVELSWFVDHTVSRELMSVPGVSRVIRSGGADQENSGGLDPRGLLAVD